MRRAKGRERVTKSKSFSVNMSLEIYRKLEVLSEFYEDSNKSVVKQLIDEEFAKAARRHGEEERFRALCLVKGVGLSKSQGVTTNDQESERGSALLPG